MSTLWSTVADLCGQLASERAKLVKRRLIAEALRTAAAVSISDAARMCLYIAGTPFPEHDPRKLSLGGAALQALVLKITSSTGAALREAYRRHGDLGDAAADLWPSPSPSESPITIPVIAETFDQIAAARNATARAPLTEALLLRASPNEARYLLKLFLGDMRTGVKQALVEEAIAEAAAQPVEAVRRAVMLEADLAAACVRAFESTLESACMKLFHPLGFMLATPADFADELPGPLFVEDKFDGMRVQLHCGDPTAPGRVALYSRNREDITTAFPEITEAFRYVTQPLILDGEILAWDLTADRPLPFAAFAQRIGRKRVDDALRRSHPVLFLAFDVLFADDALLLDLPLTERRTRLEALTNRWSPLTQSPLTAEPEQSTLFAAADPAVTQPVPRLHLSPAQLLTTSEQVEQAFAAARDRGHEGLMLKDPASLYQPGRRGQGWQKLKRELATLDVVITGAEFGHGRRAHVLSDYTFAVRGPDGELLNVGKAYSGLTDAEIAAMTEWLHAHTLSDDGYFRTVEPLRVLEVAFNNVMRSDRHASGFALRFPRILRIRDDKPVGEIDTLATVERIFAAQ